MKKQNYNTEAHFSGADVTLIPEEVVMSKIVLIRGIKVLLDKDLAEMYGVETKQLKRQVRRNTSRFPEDFMFELTQKESEILRSQFGTSSWGGIRYLPMAFTEQGVAMLSSILSSQRAIEVNIRIIRVFTKLREILMTHKDLIIKIEEMEKKLSSQDDKVSLIFNYLKQFVKQQDPRTPIGFKQRAKRK